MNKGLSVSALAIALGLSAVSVASAQTRTSVMVCRDGTTLPAASTTVPCILHGGYDQGATARGQQRGVYGSTNVNGTYGSRGIYQGTTTNGQTRGIYQGTTNGTIYQ